MLQILKNSTVCNIVKQNFHQKIAKCNFSVAHDKKIIHLNQRIILRLTGQDVSDYLQGLVTNDMKHLEGTSASLYSVFLNNKGRILFDTIIYKSHVNDTFYIECDSTVSNNLIKHLKLYKLRRKVNIDSMENDMKVWCVYNDNMSCLYESDNVEKDSKLDESNIPRGAINTESQKILDNIYIYNDPRVFELGKRIITESHISYQDIMKHLGPDITLEQNTSSYEAFRYKLGIAEGAKDLPSGVPFPLESNCDYLHGVSFHKGCYLGQELTARTHHTGVVRKRIMPLIFPESCVNQLKYDEKILNESGKIVGKVVGQSSIYGLGLIRISEGLASKTLSVGNCFLKIIKPRWWPHETQKTEVSLKSNKN